jgi:threonine dehydrogenase-like Zn-dependent dehydrogenase
MSSNVGTNSAVSVKTPKPGDLMWRVAKHEGVGNVVLEQTPIPELGSLDVLVKTHVSLISRGSELWRRYVLEEAVNPDIMGYSTTGTVVAIGERVPSLPPDRRLAPGDRVGVSAPHAEYSVRSIDESPHPRIYKLHPDVPWEEGTFHPLATSAAGWVAADDVAEQDTVVVLGQGIVGNLVMQTARLCRPKQLIAVDALELRCRLAAEVGAPIVVDAGKEDPVAAVKRLTDNVGATVVIDCVGGRAGLKSFAQAQELLAPGALLQLIGLYHGEPLPLDASRMMGKRLIGSYPPSASRAEMGARAMASLASGDIRVTPLITHRFRGDQAKEAFDFLYAHPEQAMGVLLLWD